MTRCFLSIAAGLAVITTLSAEGPLPVASIDRDEPVDYVREIQPILKRNCLACHFEQESEGGLNLETHEGVLSGGDSAAGIVPGAPEKSELWLRASGTEEPLMPPEFNDVGAESLTPEELGLLQLWIEQGATGGNGESSGIEWQAVPESVHPVYAVAVSPDGKWLARGRGNQVAVFDLASGDELATLVDPELTDTLGSEATDVDLVQSVAFSPLGDQIATGGYRTVKLWRKVHRQLEPAESPLAAAAGLVASDSEGKAWAWVNAIGDVEVWDSSDDSPSRALPGRGSFPIGLTLSAGGDRLMIGDADGGLTVWDLAGDEMLTEFDAERSLLASALAPDGRTAAAITAERTVLLWQLESLEEASEEKGKAEEPEESSHRFVEAEVSELESLSDVMAIAFVAGSSPQLAVGTGEGRVVLMDLESGEQVHVLEHGASIDAIAADREGGRLATAGRDGLTRLWNADDGSALQTLEGDPEHHLLIAAADRDHARQVALLERLESRTGEIEAAIEQEQEAVDKVQAERDEAAEKVAEDEKKRQAAEEKVTATESKIEKAKREAKEARQRIEKLKEEIADAEEGDAEEGEAEEGEAEEGEAEEGAKLAEAEEAIAESEAAIEKSEQEVERLEKQLEEDQESLRSAAEAKEKSEAELEQQQTTLDNATEAHRRIASRLPEHEARLRGESRRANRLQQRVSETQSRAAEPGRLVTGIAFSPDGQWLGTRHRDGSARIYRDGQSSAAYTLRPRSLPPAAAPRGLRFGPEQTCVLFGESSPASVWKQRPQWQLERTVGSPEDSPISDRAMAVDYRPDGLAIAVGSGPPSRFGEVKLFSTRSGKLLRDFDAIHSDTVFGLRFSPDGRTLASSAADKTIRLLDVASGEVIRSLEGHTHHVLGLDWHDNTETLASAAADQTVKVWDVETAGQRRTINGFPKEVTAVRFVAESGQIVTAGADGQVRLYNSDNGKQVRSLNVSSDFLFALAVTPDGETLVAGGQAGTVQVWNLGDGKQRHEIR